MIHRPILYLVEFNIIFLHRLIFSFHPKKQLQCVWNLRDSKPLFHSGQENQFPQWQHISIHLPDRFQRLQHFSTHRDR